MWLNVKENFQVDEEGEEGCIYFRKSVSKKRKKKGRGSTVSYGLDLVGGRSPEDLAEAYPLPLLPPGTLLSRQTGWSRRTQLPLLALGPCVRVHHVHEIKRFSRFAHALSLSLSRSLIMHRSIIIGGATPSLEGWNIIPSYFSLLCVCVCVLRAISIFFWN